DFAYSTAHLPQWIEEKTKGAVPGDRVLSIAATDIIDSDAGPAIPALSQAAPGTYVVLNAENYRELEMLTTVLSGLESAGKNYLYRSAASLVKTRLEMADSPLYTPG